MKPIIRNEHREAFREGRLEEIPEHILTLLRENYGEEEKTSKEAGKKTSKLLAKEKE